MEITTKDKLIEIAKNRIDKASESEIIYNKDEEAFFISIRPGIFIKISKDFITFNKNIKENIGKSEYESIKLQSIQKLNEFEKNKIEESKEILETCYKMISK